MNTLHKKVGCNKNLFIVIFQNSSIITNSIDCLRILRLYIFSQMVNKTKFTKCCYFSSVCLLSRAVEARDIIARSGLARQAGSDG